MFLFSCYWPSWGDHNYLTGSPGLEISKCVWSWHSTPPPSVGVLGGRHSAHLPRPSTKRTPMLSIASRSSHITSGALPEARSRHQWA